MTAAQNSKTTETLMIVEDEALVATVLRDELQDAGYKVLNLTDRHADALEVAKAEKPNLALVNIRLAGRDDGIELSEHLKALGIPVLLISGQVSRASAGVAGALTEILPGMGGDHEHLAKGERGRPQALRSCRTPSTICRKRQMVNQNHLLRLFL